MVGMLRAKQGERLSLVGYSIGRKSQRKGRGSAVHILGTNTGIER